MDIDRDLDRGLVSFAVGGVFLCFALYFVLQMVFGNDLFIGGYVSGVLISGLLGFLLLGYGLKIIIKEARQRTT